jgi:hypothetical protein
MAFARRTFVSIVLSKAAGMNFPPELVNMIVDEAVNMGPVFHNQADASHAVAAVSAAPPATGCPILTLPTELRRTIFQRYLPASDHVIPVSCAEGASRPRLSRGPVTNLMVTHRTWRSEITEILYQERIFGVHIHEGITTGGIEILNTGRQKLQYMTNKSDPRFERFCAGDAVGITRMRKIELHIYPGNEEKHDAINTYFITLALARLLDRGAKERLTHLDIIVQDAPAIVPKEVTPRAGSSYWWDSGKDAPRVSSITGISHIQLILTPFQSLSRVDHVSISIPDVLRQHVRTHLYVKRLENSMRLPRGQQMPKDDEDDVLKGQIEGIRDAFENHVFQQLYKK